MECGNPSGSGKKKDGQVLSELNIADKSIGRLSESIGELEKRLVRVLRKPETQDEEKTVEDAPVEVLVAMATEVKGISNGINRQFYRVESLLDRLEL